MECDAQSVPLVQIIGADDLAATPHVEYFIEESLKRDALSEHLLSPEVVKAELAFFHENWLDCNAEYGFALSSDPHGGSYNGYAMPEELECAGSTAEELASEYVELNFDQLSLEQLVVASTTATVTPPYGLVAEVGLTGYVNGLNYLKAKTCRCTQEPAQFACYQQLIAALQAKLAVASIDLQRYANLRIKFEISCDIVNVCYVMRPVERDLGSCEWVANKALLNFLIEARRAALNLQRDLKDLQPLYTGHMYYKPRLQLTESWGEVLALVQQQQLRAGKAAWSYPCALPQGKLLPMLSTTENALLRHNHLHFTGQHYASGLDMYAPLSPRYECMNYQCVTPLYLKRSAQPLATKPLLSDLQRAIMTQGSYWSEHVVQSYGMIELGAVISLVRPVLINQVNPQCWYGVFPGKEPSTVIVPEEIRSVNATGVPNALGSMTRADSDHFCLGQSDIQIENYNAQCQQIGASVPGSGLIYFDRLTLELIYTAPLTSNDEYHYGPVAQIAFPDVTNALTIVTKFMLTDQNCDEVHRVQLQQSVDQIATLLQESSSQVA